MILWKLLIGGSYVCCLSASRDSHAFLADYKILHKILPLHFFAAGLKRERMAFAFAVFLIFAASGKFMLRLIE